MPKVTKQTFKRPTKSSTGVLAGAVPVGDMPMTGIKMCLYGRGKTGKTTLACTFPGPILLVGTEDGTKSVRGVKGVDFLRLTNSGQVEELASAVVGVYNTVALDTAGGLQDMILKEVLGLCDVPMQKSWGMTDRQTWGVIGMQTKERLRMLLDLADQQGIHVVIIAHERNFAEEGGASELIFPTVGAALTPSVAGWLNGACDYLCQCFIREQAVQEEKTVGDKKIKMVRRLGGSEYCLRVGSHPVYMTGFRRNRTEEPMPEVIVDPNYDKVRELIEQGG